MTIIDLTFIDEIGRMPIQKYTLNCDGIDDKIDIIISNINGKKWRYSTDINEIKENVKYLSKCTVEGTKIIVPGGYSGGPRGMRKYTYPSMYDSPSNKEIKSDMNISCLQEGPHMRCSLQPRHSS